IICTHNPRPHYLRSVLNSLRRQTLPLKHWELLLVDNASQRPLTLDTPDLSWHPCGRIIREDQLGLAVARLRGVREAAAEILLFVDDDNVLAQNYLEQALRIGHEWPMLGVWGSGAIIPEFEVDPPEHLREFLDLLALQRTSRPRWSNVIPC